MLRSLAPHQNESELVRLCHQKSWNCVLRRCQSHPADAAPTDACLRGAGSTALAVAIRGGAPPAVVEAVLAANPHQVAMTNRHRGSVLHEALKHRCSDEVLQLLLSAVMEYQTASCTSPMSGRRALLLSRSEDDHHQTFKHVNVQEHRFVRYPNLFEATDDMNQTALHLLVERARTLASNFRRSDETFRFFQELLAAYPEAVQAKDADGHTPLLLLLMSPRGPVVGGKLESDICRMVGRMLSVCLGASSLALGRGAWCASSRHGGSNRRFSSRSHHASSKLVGSSLTRSAAAAAATATSSGSTAPIPVYYAILHGRSLETIQLLLHDHRRALGRPAGSLMVTNFAEALLHVAVTTRAPPSILYQLVSDCPESTCHPDVFGLTAMDWVWIRHCLDSHQTNGDATAAILTTRIISRRRHVPTGYSDWHERSLRSIESLASVSSASSPLPSVRTTHPIREERTPVEQSMATNSTIPQNPVALRSSQEELLRRIKLLLPVAASIRACASSADCEGNERSAGGNVRGEASSLRYPFSLVHSVCYVPCPNAFVHVALSLDNPAIVRGSLRTRDAFRGRLPLHYAASRSSYFARVPTGVSSSNVHIIKEAPVVPLVAASFPEACRVVDSSGQLPLHVAIDTYKYRRSQHQSNQQTLVGTLAAEEISTSEVGICGAVTDGDESKDETVVVGLQVIHALLGHFPGSLERRDGRTGLFPWQQSGVVPSATGSAAGGICYTTSTTLTFTLLRACPTAGLDCNASL